MGTGLKFCCGAMAMLLTIPCRAQSGKAELSGRVLDASGLVVAGARVTAEDDGRAARFTSVTDASGEYHLVGMPIGEYVFSVARVGFQGYRRAGVRLRIDDRMELDVRLAVGDLRQTVEVSGQVPLLLTVPGSPGFDADARTVLAMPLDGRNFIPLVGLSPGVALPGGGSLLPRINGSRPRTNEYLYDGVSALQPEPGQVVFYPIVDAIAEFRVETEAAAPEYGRTNGGVVAVLMKSGGNGLHGTAFEFLRNEALNARNYFAQPGAKPEFRRNQYGFTVGGPVKKDQTFFFMDWQGSRLRTGITRFSTVPTVAQRAGGFAGSIYDPATDARVQFAGNKIPASRFDPVGRQVLDRYPLPNRSGAANNFVRKAVEPDSQDQFDTRVDQVLTPAQRAFARYSYLRDDDTPVTPLPDGSGSIGSGVISRTATRGDQVVVEHGWAVRTALLNEARFGFTRRQSDGAGPSNGGLTVASIPGGSFAAALSTFTVSGLQQIGAPAGANSRFSTHVTEYLDTLAWVHGRHTVKVGVDVRSEALDVVQPPNPAGSYMFNTTGTNKLGVAGSGNAVASLLLGQVSAFSIDIQRRALEERAHVTEFFAGDEWKVTDRVTLNTGTRYTLNFPSYEKHGQGAVFNLRTQKLEFPRTARDLECRNFGPRLGAALRVNSSTMVRAGYGLVWFEQTGVTTPFTLPQFPFVQTTGQQTADNVNAAFALATGPVVREVAAGPDAGLGQGVFGSQRGNGSGYSQQWNFTVQKTFAGAWNFEMAYVGSKNTRLGLPEANLNQLPAGDLKLGAALLAKVANPFYGEVPATSSLHVPLVTEQQLLRAFPRFTTVALFRNNVGNSSYEAAQARLEKRFGKGLSCTLAYTLSKLIDDASSYFSQTIFTGPVLNNAGAADAFNRHLEKDVSSGDIPRVFSAGWVYELPRVWGLGGWSVAGVVRVQAGDAVAVAQATNSNSSLGYAVQRPNRVGDPNGLGSRSAGEWFDTAAFTVAPQFTIGTSSRNPVRGPGLQNADLMVAKIFRVSERVSAEFRVEAFNVNNTPPLNDPNGSFGAAGFGSITSAGNPRDLEMALKIRF